MIQARAGALFAGKYELLRPLARGGMGEVWVAKHRELGAERALKLMDPVAVALPEARVRFEREATSASRIESQHVVHIYDYGVELETPYIVMELLRGEDLSQRLRRGRLTLPAAAHLATQIGKALRAAHDAGVVHRDLKPANVFLAIKDGDEIVKVLDFGIAKATGPGEGGNITATGVLLGSIHYMSPEQIRRSSSVDHRSDLWSLSVILYRALTGKLPFPGAPHEVIAKVCTTSAPLPSELVPELPAAIDRFFVRGLARDPAQRFQSAGELVAGLDTIAREAGAPAEPAPSPIVLTTKNGTELMTPRPPATGTPEPFRSRDGTVFFPRAAPAGDSAPIPALAGSRDGTASGLEQRTLRLPADRSGRAVLWVGGLGLLALLALGAFIGVHHRGASQGPGATPTASATMAAAVSAAAPRGAAAADPKPTAPVSTGTPAPAAAPLATQKTREPAPRSPKSEPAPPIEAPRVRAPVVKKADPFDRND